MLHIIKKYFQYRKNKKIVKRELAEIGAITLPFVRNLTDTTANIIKLIINLSEASEDIDGEKLLKMVIDEISGNDM